MKSRNRDLTPGSHDGARDDGDRLSLALTGLDGGPRGGVFLATTFGSMKKYTCSLMKGTFPMIAS